jgi:acyl carrier protein
LYGPTETTLVKLFYVVPDIAPNGIQPIGQSMPQAQALILNQADVLCGVGETGQIVIRTPFQSLGYINLPEQTAHVFRNNPFSNNKRDIVYYTGDLGRYRSDGSAEILGRIDNQIKIRGVRIEPEEITAILDKHDAIYSSVVLAVKKAERNYLVGYVAPNKNATITIPEIRSYLSQQLPQVMIPEQFVFLEEIPLKANGKIDRGALPAPDQIHSESEQQYVPPRSPVEEMLAAIWRDVLKIDQIGIHDNFFEFGGHSLLAVQLIVRINKQLQIEFPLYALFETPTVAGLSAQLETVLKQNIPYKINLIKALQRKPCQTK